MTKTRAVEAIRPSDRCRTAIPGMAAAGGYGRVVNGDTFPSTERYGHEVVVCEVISSLRTRHRPKDGLRRGLAMVGEAAIHRGSRIVKIVQNSRAPSTSVQRPGVIISASAAIEARARPRWKGSFGHAPAQETSACPTRCRSVRRKSPFIRE